MRQPNPKAEQAKADDWNAKYPVGTAVDVRLDNGSTFRTVTTAPATVLGGHTAVAWLEYVQGCYALDRVTPAAKEQAA